MELNLESFWQKVGKAGANGCWVWLGSKTKHGYGQFGGRKLGGRTHRLSWGIFNGPIPPGLSVLHRCDVRNCVNPDHLFLGTQSDNMKDAAAKGRLRFGVNAHSARLSEADVIAARAAKSSLNITVKELARIFKVGATTMHAVINRTSWKHL